MILVIGATGFVGTYLIDELLRQEKKIIATGRNIENDKYFQSLKNVTCINLNISNSFDFKKLPKKGIKTVIQLAGLMPANVKKEDYDPYKYIDVNIKGTLNILEYCRENDIERMIFTSSESDISKKYGTDLHLDEKTTRAINYNNDHTIYAISKIAAMDLIEHYSQKYGIIGISFRLPNIFGYGQLLEIYHNGEKTLNGFGTFLKKAIHGETIEIWGNPKLGRDVVYIKDLISMITNAIYSPKARGLYCVGTGIKTTLEEEVKTIVKVFSKSDNISKIIYKPEMPSIRNYIYDIKKAKTELNYIVKYPFYEMLNDWKHEMELNRFPHLRYRIKEIL